jgi:hypothetical protein
MIRICAYRSAYRVIAGCTEDRAGGRGKVKSPTTVGFCDLVIFLVRTYIILHYLNFLLKCANTQLSVDDFHGCVLALCAIIS